MEYNCIIVLGPTAVGKTSIGVAVADALDGEIISADSRQTYRKLNIGSGKDLDEYEVDGKIIPYHLIDIIDLPAEYTVYDYQKDFYKAFKEIQERGRLPVIVGGTGMYLDSIVRNYELVNIPENKELRKELEGLSLEELGKRVLKDQPVLHVMADLQERERLIKAIEIIEAKKAGYDTTSSSRPDIKPFIIGTTLPRPLMWENIRRRLEERIAEGMIDEVKEIHESGISFERLEKLGLEYRFCSEYLEGKYKSQEEMTEKLFIAIRQFAKRQETWFRMMEKKGVTINWLKPVPDKKERIEEALKLISGQKRV
jgi:tRNA dimethylallyltransferase